jgi:two-component system NtrC family sensor kinase
LNVFVGIRTVKRTVPFLTEEPPPLPHLPLPLALAALALLAVAGIAVWAMRLRRRLARSERERRRTADELNRRLSELFSLQELAYVLSESLQLDRIVEQVVRYAMRFLDARGALLALATDQAGETRQLRVAAAEGTLAPLEGRSIARDDPGLVARSLDRERLELVRNSGEAPTALLSGVEAESAAAVPLRAQGVVVGTLVIADPRGGVFHPEDIRLLSTVATHAAVALANARLFEMVRHAKEQWETAFDALREGMAVVDEGGRVLRANRSLARMLDRPVATVVGEELVPALVGQAREGAELLDAARRGEQVPALVAHSERLQRSLRIHAARISGTGPEQSVVVLVEDVTDQQAMEAQLIQSAKLAAVGQLVSGVAHELNNPLTSIAGLSEFLLEQKEVGPKDRDHLQVIHEQAERAGRIVGNLLTFARKGTAERARVNLNDVVQRTLLLMSYDLKLKDIRIEENLVSGVPEVMGDSHALQQVVLNLVTNAAHAVAANGPGRPRTIRINTRFDERVRLRVADTGPGIPDEVLPHLFTPFFTTKEPGQGTGLGLSITYSIVEAHGGRITVERPADGGAVFLVDLPPADPPAAKRTILLVDDDPAVRRMVKALFGQDGHTVEVARNPGQALDLARARTYDLILADGQATARGRRFVQELVEARPELRGRILVATGDVRPATEETVGQLGLRYVRKPFNLRDLRDEAARVWAAAALS